MATWTYNGTSANNTIAPPQNYAIYSIDGGAGTDTLYIDDSSRNFSISPLDSNGVITVSGASGTKLYLSNIEKVSFKNGVTTTLPTAAPVSTAVNGGSGNDSLTGTSANNVINGGAGIDTVLMTGTSRASATLTKSGSDWLLSSTATGSDTLTNVERIRFADSSVALDINDHAGSVAKILGAVFGREAVSNKSYAGIGLNLIDGGTSYQALAALAINASGKSTPSDVVTLLWTNLMGKAPTTAEAKPFVDMLNSGTSTGELGVMAADFAAQIGVVDLGTLGQTGLGFV